MPLVQAQVRNTKVVKIPAAKESAGGAFRARRVKKLAAPERAGVA
jgi:hypothetical protein